jgi:hypothetical protein
MRHMVMAACRAVLKVKYKRQGAQPERPDSCWAMKIWDLSCDSVGRHFDSCISGALDRNVLQAASLSDSSAAASCKHSVSAMPRPYAITPVKSCRPQTAAQHRA